MRRVNWTFAVALFLIVAAVAGGFHALHVVRYGHIADDLRWQVDRAREAGKPDDAIKFAAQYLDFRPADVEMMADLAGWLREKAKATGQLKGVLNLYVRILRYTPDDVATRLKAAELGMALYDWASAIDNLDVLLRARPDDAELCEHYADCHYSIGKYVEAAGWYERAVRADPKRVTAYVGHANVLQYGLRQPAQALARVEEAARINPQSGFAHAARATYLRLNGKLDEAAKAVEAAQSCPSDNELEQQKIILVAADIEQTVGHYDVARRLLEDGYHKYPKNSQFVFNLAWQLVYEGRADVAIAKLREAREKAAADKQPQNPDVLTLLGDLLAQDGQVAPLEDALRELTEMGAPADRVQYIQARLLLRRGRWAEAAALLDKLRMIALRTPSLFRQANLLLAQCFEQLGDVAGELDAYRRLLDNDPNAGTVRLDYARALARTGRFDEAVSQYLPVVPRAEVSSRAVAQATRDIADRVRTDPKSWAKLERAIDGLKAETPNPALARAYLDLARYRAADSFPVIDGLVRKNHTNVALHVARADLAEQVYGLDRALAALADGQALIGDLPDLRVTRARLLAVRMDAAFADELAKLARGVERFGAEDRARILREVVAAFRMLGDSGAVGLHLDLLAKLRPDSITVREELFAQALKAGDEARCRAIHHEVETIEGPDGPAARLLDAQQMLWLCQSGDTAALDKAGEHLVAAARGRPHDPVVELLRGRVDELAGRATDALHHYQAAFDAGLADLPVEDLFANVFGKSGTSPIAVLRDQLPLADRLRPDRHRSLIVACLPLYQSAGLTAIAGRLATVAPPADAVTQVWLGRLFARVNLDRPAEESFHRAAAGAPQSPEGWLALVAYETSRGNESGVKKARAEIQERMSPIDSHLVSGKAFESARQFDVAQREYESAAALKPDDTRPLKMLAMLAATRGETEESRRRLEQIVALPNPSVPEDQTWARRTLAVQLAMSQSAEALGRALALVDQNKVNGQLSDDDQRARVLILAAQRGRLLPDGNGTARREAIRILEELRQHGGARSADDLVLLARMYRADGDEAGARQARERMAAEYPTHIGCVAFLAREALRDQDLPGCERLLPTLKRLGSGQFDTVGIEFQWNVLAGKQNHGVHVLDDYVGAATSVEEKSARAVRCANLIYDFLQVHPTDDRSPVVSDLRAAAVRLYRPEALRQGDVFQRLVTLLAAGPNGTNPAIELVQQGKRTFGPEVAATAYVQIVRHGRPGPNEVQKRAIAQFIKDERDKAPRSTPLLLTWAEFLQLTGENAEAVAVYREVLRREPDNVLALNNLAWTLSLDRRDEAKVRESLTHIQRAIELAGPLDDLLDTRARILFESGQREAGLRDMCDAVTEAPSAARLTDYAVMLQKAGKAKEAERALAAANRLGLGAH
jgi:tetratricopeptide (TPR) repeat protein